MNFQNHVYGNKSSDMYVRNICQLSNPGRHKVFEEFSVQMDYVIEPCRPDSILVDKKSRTCKMIDFYVSGNKTIE